MKKIGLLLILACVSCDISTSLLIDGQKDFVLSNQCGIIMIKGSSFTTAHSTFVLFSFKCFNGPYYINTDSLMIETGSNELEITNLRFEANNVVSARKEMEIGGGELLTLFFTLQSKSTPPNNMINNRTIILPPSNFIMCEGKPVICDTIRIQLKDSQIRVRHDYGN